MLKEKLIYLRQFITALTQSHRTNSDKELIRFGSKFAGLQGKVHKSQLEVELKLRLTPNGKKLG